MKKNLLNGLKRLTALMLTAFMMLSVFEWDRPEGLFVLPVITQAEAEEDSGTNNLDGSKIEGVYVEWITPDSLTTAEGEATPQAELDDRAHLYLSTTNNEELVMIYRVMVQLSGQFDYKPGDVSISIPAQVWPTRAYDEDGVGIVNVNVLQGELELPVPEAPSTKADFNWQLVGDQYVLTNTRTLSAASSVSVEVAIRGLTPMDIVDMSTCNDITANCEVVTNRGNVIHLRSMPINAQIDTIARISYVYKDGEVFENAASRRNC